MVKFYRICYIDYFVFYGIIIRKIIVTFLIKKVELVFLICYNYLRLSEAEY